MTQVQPVILAGSSGKRLWPLSPAQVSPEAVFEAYR